MKEYRKLRLKYLSKPSNKYCKAKIPGVCMGRQVQGIELTIHHKKGRGRYLLDTNTWLPCCMMCHRYIEENPDFAKELGFSEDRLTKK